MVLLYNTFRSIPIFYQIATPRRTTPNPRARHRSEYSRRGSSPAASGPGSSQNGLLVAGPALPVRQPATEIVAHQKKTSAHRIASPSREESFEETMAHGRRQDKVEGAFSENRPAAQGQSTPSRRHEGGMAELCGKPGPTANLAG